MSHIQKGRVLVTGANGLLGSNIVEELNKQNYCAIAMTRKGANKLGLAGLRYVPFEGQVTDENDIDQAISDCDYVIHSAAQTRHPVNKLESYQEANIESTKLVVKACVKYKVKRLVFVSTANCFSNGTIENPGNESKGFMPWLEKSGYAYSKHLAQEYVLKEAKAKGLEVVVVAPTFMIGGRDAGPSSGALLLHGLKNRFVFCPPGGKSFVDVRYAAEATVNALTMGSSGEAYLLAGQNLTFSSFFKKVEELTSQKKFLLKPSYGSLKTVASICEKWNNSFSSSLPFDKVTQRLFCLDNYFCNDKAQKELNMKETRIEHAMEDAIAWFKTYKYI
ncbi:NAD-dependent epimerase/dehydratase family protein [Aureibacter tunicatorum]|uniref:Dihydroflavonol-4-reductase n=1 Tax=Aureibacter tunicatorum TaxID=866807 RepID=A0AAE4BRE7_9BACT|nr:NAD-dependent epimerase/dehydratase family protein [Aureibacter tunicatorum]MDR6237868.1 dihydroflavonol-4-reductase [Aureibacter tunicatorum]BDD02903.1 dihydroflavonol-4-reductase [Aureibacter tunicatorum]